MIWWPECCTERRKERVCLRKAMGSSQKFRETEILCLNYQNGRINVL